MTDWTETYRGAVPPWQCDVTEHFTIAYYFDRLEEAEANLTDVLGLGDLSRRGDLARRLDARFVRELRAGSQLPRRERGGRPLEGDNQLRLGHRFVDSSNGEVVTWFDDIGTSRRALTPQQRGAIEARRAIGTARCRTTARAGHNRRLHRHRVRTGQGQ